MNIAESIQRILVRRGLAGQNPQLPEHIIGWLEGVARGWNDDPKPFGWGGSRAACRERSRNRRHALGGSGACAHHPIRAKQNLVQKWHSACQLTHQVVTNRIIRGLVLEDDLETLAQLMKTLSLIEQHRDVSISVTVLSEYRQVDDVNADPNANFDFILLDRDCKLGGSFHGLDLNKFPRDRIIGISSMPNYNQALKEKGVTLIVEKDYQKLAEFANKVGSLIEELIDKQSL